MHWQAFHKRRASKHLPTVRLRAGHPPLTSLRSFAPPYAEAKGAYGFPPFTGEMPEGQRGPPRRAQHPVIPAKAGIHSAKSTPLIINGQSPLRKA